MGIFDFNNDGRTSFGEGFIAAGVVSLLGLGSPGPEPGREGDAPREQEPPAPERGREDAPAAGEVVCLDSDDSYLDGLSLSKPDAADLEGARRAAEHISTAAREPNLLDGVTCEDCAFWHHTAPFGDRGHGCRIWYLVQIEYGGAIPDQRPREDGLTCDRFARGTRVPSTCYDCVHWSASDPVAMRSEGCDVWAEMSRESIEMRMELWDRMGPGVDFTVFSDDRPWVDGDVCFRLEMDPALPRGYGLDRIRFVEGYIESHRVTACSFRVAGIRHEGRAAVWARSLAGGAACGDIRLVREPGNEHDANAVAVYVGGEKGGYVPRKKAPAVAERLDAGCEARVVSRVLKAEQEDGSEEKLRVELTVELRPADGACCPPERCAPAGEAPLPDDVYPATPQVIAAIKGDEGALLENLRAAKEGRRQ